MWFLLEEGKGVIFYIAMVLYTSSTISPVDISLEELGIPVSLKLELTSVFFHAPLLFVGAIITPKNEIRPKRIFFIVPVLEYKSREI